MKRALILHAMEQTSNGHWYQWLKQELESRGYRVWVPDLPHPDMPNNVEVKDMLLDSDWDFSDSLIIGHSSGAMQALFLLQSLPKSVVVSTAVLVSSFDRPVPGMEKQHVGLFDQAYDFEAISSHAKNLLFVHGADDPWCPVQGAENLSQQTNGELVIVQNGGHFSTTLNERYTKFPELVDILTQRALL